MTWNVPEHLRFETPFSSPACEDVELVVIHGTVTPVVSPDSQWIDAAHVLAKLHRLVPDPSDFSSAVGMGSQVDRLIRWALGQGTRSSTHYIVLKDGTVLQCADPHEVRCWHAGRSSWTNPDTGERKNQVNRRSIGVDLDNVGPLRREAGKVLNAYDGEHLGRVVEVDGRLWEPYTSQQIAGLQTLLHQLAGEFPVLRRPGRIVGHVDVSPGRKTDPWPPCPMGLARVAASANWVPMSTDLWADVEGVV